MANNYTLGRGEVHFSRFLPASQTPEGYRYLGNTPEFNLTIESDELEHFSSDEGIRELDDSVPLEVTRSGSLITDNIDPENVALFFFGDASVLTQASVVAAPEMLMNILAGHSYQLGVTPARPAGYMGINPTGFSVDNLSGVGGTALVAGTDYTMNFDTGIITFLPGSLLAIDGADIEVTYAVRASSRSVVLSGSQPVEGAMKFISKNPKGSDVVITMPYVKLSPNGDYALKGDDWQQIPLSISVLKPDVGEAIYRNGLPAYS